MLMLEALPSIAGKTAPVDLVSAYEAAKKQAQVEQQREQKAVRSEQINWQCTSCTVWNEKNKAACGMCGNKYETLETTISPRKLNRSDMAAEKWDRVDADIRDKRRVSAGSRPMSQHIRAIPRLLTPKSTFEARESTSDDDVECASDVSVDGKHKSRLTQSHPSHSRRVAASPRLDSITSLNQTMQPMKSTFTPGVTGDMIARKAQTMLDEGVHRTVVEAFIRMQHSLHQVVDAPTPCEVTEPQLASSPPVLTSEQIHAKAMQMLADGVDKQAVIAYIKEQMARMEALHQNATSTSSSMPKVNPAPFIPIIDSGAAVSGHDSGDFRPQFFGPYPRVSPHGLFVCYLCRYELYPGEDHKTIANRSILLSFITSFS